MTSYFENQPTAVPPLVTYRTALINELRAPAINVPTWCAELTTTPPPKYRPDDAIRTRADKNESSIARQATATSPKCTAHRTRPRRHGRKLRPQLGGGVKWARMCVSRRWRRNIHSALFGFEVVLISLVRIKLYADALLGILGVLLPPSHHSRTLPPHPLFLLSVQFNLL